MCQQFSGRGLSCDALSNLQHEIEHLMLQCKIYIAVSRTPRRYSHIQGWYRWTYCQRLQFSLCSVYARSWIIWYRAHMKGFRGYRVKFFSFIKCVFKIRWFKVYVYWFRQQHRFCVLSWFIAYPSISMPVTYFASKARRIHRYTVWDAWCTWACMLRRL